MSIYSKGLVKGLRDSVSKYLPRSRGATPTEGRSRGATPSRTPTGSRPVSPPRTPPVDADLEAGEGTMPGAALGFADMVGQEHVARQLAAQRSHTPPPRARQPAEYGQQELEAAVARALEQKLSIGERDMDAIVRAATPTGAMTPKTPPPPGAMTPPPRTPTMSPYGQQGFTPTPRGMATPPQWTPIGTPGSRTPVDSARDSARSYPSRSGSGGTPGMTPPGGTPRADDGWAGHHTPGVPRPVDPIRAVFSAARHGKWRDVQTALEGGMDPGVVDSKGNTLFHVACQNGHKKVAKAVAKFGGTTLMNAQNDKGNTGLHFLVQYGYTELAEYFCSKRVDTTLRNHEGRLPLEGLGK